MVLLALAAMAISLLASGPARATPDVDGNPDLPQRCGTDMTVIIDRSASIGDHNTTVAGAANALVSGLAGTGSKVQVISFSDTATALGNRNGDNDHDDLIDLEFVPAESLTVPTFPSGGHTNWDDAMEMARRSPAGVAPLTVILTDGNPTAYNAFHPDGHGLAYFQTEIEPFLTTAFSQARAESNYLKRAGTHILAVGIGDDINAAKLRLISGEEQITTGGDVSLAEGDWTMVEFTELESMLEDFVTELCAPSVNVTKTEIPLDGPARTGDGWEFTLDLSDQPSVWQSPLQPASSTSATLSTAEGKANFKWENVSNAATTGAVITESPRPGWVFDGVTCMRRNYETNSTSELTVNAVTGADGSVSWVVPDGLGSSDSVNCAVTNREVGSSRIDILKLTEPAGSVGSFDFELSRDGRPAGVVAGLSHGDTGQLTGIAPGTYELSEQEAPGFDLTGAVCDDMGTEEAESVSPDALAVGANDHWSCTFVNTARPGPSISVTKTASERTVDEPGAAVTYTATVTNAGQDPVTISSIVDSVDGGAPIDLTGDSAPLMDTTCDSITTLEPGATGTCTFTLMVQGEPGDAVYDVVNVTAVDEADRETSDSAEASVGIANVLPTITATKIAGTATVAAPGDTVEFTVTMTNTALEEVMITSIMDTVAGESAIDVTLTGDTVVGTTCDDALGAWVDPGQSFSCAFTLAVAGEPGDVVRDSVEFTVSDDDGSEASVSAEAEVEVVDVLPLIEVTKTDGDATVGAAGGVVTYTVAVENRGVDPVTISSITDSVEGSDPIDVAVVDESISATSCAVGEEIAVGATYTCKFDITVTGEVGTEVVDEVEVTVVDADDHSGTDADMERTPVVGEEELVDPPPPPPPTVQQATETQPTAPAPTPAAVIPAQPASSAAKLAVTGSEVQLVALLGLAAIAIGVGLLRLDGARRRRAGWRN